MHPNRRILSEPARDIPVRDKVDVIIAGGGLGGISAAIAAARAGAKTLLIERNGFLGGVATAGMVCSIFNCYYTADHRLGITGNAVEIADALARPRATARSGTPTRGTSSTTSNRPSWCSARWCRRPGRRSCTTPSSPTS